MDQIVIGSRGGSTLRRYLGSVSSQVVAQAECPVTVVKAAEPVESLRAEPPAPAETGQPFHKPDEARVRVRAALR